ncbi:DegV family protein [Tumebacillus sp. DT12]|uniref:DegV family protein n=1 Tax=Tumebacillus lacus TaxID=2995335 RepID=A0ABT3X3K4_9BACL|nr:DegV family protein [Tumebacillus lacus]MCX7571470.1 DegV family protein [Tumebacillus lacus]
MIRIVTDSTSDLTVSMIEQYGIEVVPLNVIFEGTAYADGVELSKEQFYERMAASKTLPTTSQPSPALMRERFQKVLDAGNDVYYVGLSSSLSGTMQSAKIARDLVSDPERVTIFDSLNVAIGQGMLAMEAAKMANDGKTPAEITAVLTELRNREKLVFSVAHLDNLRKSGRINNLSFLFGSLLSIKPIMMLDIKGVVQVYEKARGKKNALLALMRHLEEFPPDPDYTLYVVHAHVPEQAQELEAAVREKTGMTNTQIIYLSGVIGAHVGEGTTGMFYFAKK